MKNKIETRNSCSSDSFDSDLLRLIALHFPDYRIWVDIYNIYSLTKHRVYDMDRDIVFDPDECLAVSVLRVAYPNLIRRIVENKIPFAGACPFSELIFISDKLHIDKPGDKEKRKTWERYPFIQSCVQNCWLNVEYPIYLIDWEGDLTPKAWLLMESSKRRPLGEPPFWANLSYIHLNEDDCRSLFRHYPFDAVCSQLTSNQSLLRWAILLDDDGYMRDLNTRRENIFKQIVDDFRRELDVWRNTSRYLSKSEKSISKKPFVDTDVSENVCAVFGRLNNTDEGRSLCEKLWKDVINIVFIDNNAYIAILFICVLEGFDLHSPSESSSDMGMTKDENDKIIHLNLSSTTPGMNTVANIYTALGSVKHAEHYEGLIDSYKRLYENCAGEYKRDYVALIEGFCSFYAVCLNRYATDDDTARKNLGVKLLTLVNERVSMNSTVENEERNRQFQSFKERLDTGWLPGDDEADEGKSDNKPDGKPEDK